MQCIDYHLVWFSSYVCSAKWAEELGSGQTASSLAASLFYFDQAIVYTEREHKLIQTAIQAIGIESSAGGDDEDNEEEEEEAYVEVCI
jgi:hypothetical protein